MQNTELFEVCILRIKQEKRRELREKKRLMIEEEKNRIEEQAELEYLKAAGMLPNKVKKKNKLKLSVQVFNEELQGAAVTNENLQSKMLLIEEPFIDT